MRPKGQDFMTLGQQKRMVDNIARTNRPYYTMCISGGEPTTVPHIGEFIEYFAEKIGTERIQRVYVISNGSRNVELYRKFVQLAQKGLNLQLFISIHTDHASLGHIIELVENISPHIYLRFALMFNPRKREFVHEIFNKLCEYRQNYKFHNFINLLTLGENKLHPDYIDADFNWQKEANIRFNEIAAKNGGTPYFINTVFNEVRKAAVGEDNYSYFAQNNILDSYYEGESGYQNMYCCTGANLWDILPDGTVRGSVCGFSHKARNSVWQEYPYNDPQFVQAIKCPAPDCACPANNTLQKFADAGEANVFLRNFWMKQRRLSEIDTMREAFRDSMTGMRNAMRGQNSEGDVSFNSLVDTQFYLEANPDVKRGGMGAAEHYWKYGWKEGRWPNRWFDPKFYVEKYPDAAESGMIPLLHFVLKGLEKGYYPNKKFIPQHDIREDYKEWAGF